MENTKTFMTYVSGDRVYGFISTFIPSRPDPGRRGENDLNFYFHTSLWYLRRFFEGLGGLLKAFKYMEREELKAL